jgi:Rieske Fe-S protein
MCRDERGKRRADRPLPAAGDGLTTGTNRRTVLRGAVGAGLALSVPIVVNAAKPAHKQRPQPGDVLAHRFGELKGQPVSPAQVPTGAELLQAAGKDPVSGVLRDGSRLNGVNVVRLEAKVLDDQTRPLAIIDDQSGEGIVAYSSVCTHQGCDLTQWLPESRAFKCYCHYSEFNAAEFGKPIHGPATRRLAILPLKLEGGVIVVAGAFVGKVGFKKKQF